MRLRIAAVVGIVVFSVLAGTGVSYALWTANAATTGSVTAASPITANCVSPTRLLNGSFESPNITPNPYSQLTPSLVPNWAVANDNVIEIWRGQGAVVPPTGAQLAELNGNAYGTLYQDVVTVPGQTLRWSVQHRGREGADQMSVSVNAAGAALVEQARFTDPVGPWVLHTGAYVVPAGQTTTRISLTPVSTFNNQVSIGNLIDDVTLGSGPCLQASAVVSNITNPGGTYRVGDTVQYVTTITNIGGAPATPSTWAATLPSTLTYNAGTLIVDGTSRTDASGDDVATYASGVVSARIGYGGTATTGGIVSPEQTVTVTFRATITAAAAGGNVVLDSAATSYDLFAPNWPMTAPATTTTPVPSADLAVAVGTRPTIATGGASVTWTLTVTNNGPAAGTGVSAAVSLPAGLTARAVSASGGATCTTPTPAQPAASTSTCTIGALASGASRTITITGTLPATLVGVYPVTVTASGLPSDAVSGNNAATNNGIDGAAPTVPGTPAYNAGTATLSWAASTDNVAVTQYRVFRNGVDIGTTATNSLVLNGANALAAGQPYWFWVKAEDAATNSSAASNGAGAIGAFGTGAYRISWTTGTTTRCLGTAGIVTINVQSLTCGAPLPNNQRWTITSVGTNVYRISPMDVTTRGWNLQDDNSNDNNDVEANGNNAAENRARWVPTVVFDSTTNTAYVQFFSALASTTKCVESTGASTTSGTQVQINTCSNIPSRRFTLTAAP